MCLLHKNEKKLQGEWDKDSYKKKKHQTHTTPTNPLSSEFERSSLQEISILSFDTNFI